MPDVTDGTTPLLAEAHNRDTARDGTLEREHVGFARREFLKRATLVAAGLSLAGAVLAQSHQNPGALPEVAHAGSIDRTADGGDARGPA